MREARNEVDRRLRARVRVRYKGRQLGYHGVVARLNFDPDKVINSGEGGFITTDDDDIAARCLYMSGCYEEGTISTRACRKLCEVHADHAKLVQSRMNGQYKHDASINQQLIPRTSAEVHGTLGINFIGHRFNVG